MLMPLAQHLNRLLDLLTEEVIRDKPASPPLRRSTTDLAEEPGETTLWAVALEVGGKLNAVVLTLRGRRQEDELGIGEFHGDLQ